MLLLPKFYKKISSSILAFDLVVVQTEPPVLVISAGLCPVHNHLDYKRHKIRVDDVVCHGQAAAAQPPPTESMLYHYVEHLHLYSIDYIACQGEQQTDCLEAELVQGFGNH